MMAASVLFPFNVVGRGLQATEQEASARVAP
jgi:hypothetical protein